MKAVLIVFMTFHFDAGATHEKVMFDSLQACEAARSVLVAEYVREGKDGDGWGRQRMLAVCLPDTTDSSKAHP